MIDYNKLMYQAAQKNNLTLVKKLKRRKELEEMRIRSTD